MLVSAQPPGSAGADGADCAHPRDEDITGKIPTISFVSLRAGLIQALELAVGTHVNYMSADTGRRRGQAARLGQDDLGLPRARNLVFPAVPRSTQKQRKSGRRRRSTHR